MRILVAQLNYIIGDIEGNIQKILKAMDHARAQKIECVLFSELAVCGYPPEDLLLHESFIERAEKALDAVIQASSDLFIVIGTPRRNLTVGEKPLLNSAAIISDRKLLGYQDKWLLPTYDVFDERRYFEPGSSLSTWECKGKRIAVMICEDIWQHAGYIDFTTYPRDPVLSLEKHAPDLVLNLSASPYQYQKPDIRVKVCAKAAQTLKCPVVMCCQVGGNDQLIFDGYSVCTNEKGQLCQIAKGFEEEEMIVDLAQLTPLPSLSLDPMQDLYSALVLGVRDYFHKSGFKKGCLGLSGGIDSALVACIASEALGKENVLGIAMPSRYSSQSSLDDAKALAENLGIQYTQVSIEQPFESFLSLLEPSFTGTSSDITEENIQARIRGVILMAFSNKFGYVILSTGNKSEMAMGYCTLYGDMCGGLSVISDVTKTQVYALARWINRKQEIIPRSSIDKPPSAELRPNQKDSDSLPDYAIVDTVLQSYVEEFLSPEEIAKKHSISLNLVQDLVQKIHKAEYKRRQAAPGIRVSKKAFRAGRRYPIVQKWV
jgi:NAD+ synthase (glutamine-hydrolysing)